MPVHKGIMVLTVSREGAEYKVTFVPEDPDELAVVAAAVVRALIVEGGVDFGQVCEYLRSIR